MQMLDDSNIDVDDYDFRIVSPNGRYDHETAFWEMKRTRK